MLIGAFKNIGVTEGLSRARFVKRGKKPGRGTYSRVAVKGKEVTSADRLGNARMKGEGWRNAICESEYSRE